ncbi:MAG: hypothetical protein WBG37_02760 [Desulfobacterales bacterium]|jgi:hypothetical protein
MRKIVLWLMAALAIAFIADYYGYVSLPWLHRETPSMLETKKKLIHKSETAMEEPEAGETSKE